MKKRSLLSMTIIVCIFCYVLVSPVSASFSTASDARNIAHERIETAVVEWVIDSYGEHYTVRNIDVTVEKTLNSQKNILKEKLIVTFEKMLLVDSAEKLPYVIGLRQASLTRSQEDVQYVDSYVASLSEYIGVYTNTCVDIVGECSINDISKGVTLYYQDVYTTTIYPIEVLTFNNDKMFSDGIRDVESIINYEKNAAASRGYDDYNRRDARDYALRYSSNEIAVCSCPAGANCTSAKYNSSKWNSDYSIYPHVDCCNYSSQAMLAGGIPTDSTWYKDSLAWINSNALKEYMTTTKGYWDSSTFAAANAGNILRWKNTATSSQRHTVIITLNDTVSHEYSAHTTDRVNCRFYENSNYEFYTIKTNP